MRRGGSDPVVRATGMKRGTRPVRLRAHGVTTVVVVLALSGCGAERAPQRAGAAGPTPALAATPAARGGPMEWVLVPGHRTVVPIEPALIDEMTGTEVRLDDGTVLEVHPYAVRVDASRLAAAPDPTSIAAKASTWLGNTVDGRPVSWSAERVASAAAVGSGAAVMSVDAPRIAGGLPAESGGQVGGRRVTVRWEAGAMATPTGLGATFGRTLGEAEQESAWVRAALASAESSPLTRWRAQLCRGQLFSEDVRGVFVDPVIESLAQGIEWRWRAALVRLARVDQLTARAVVERLCAMADFGGGVIMPVWPPEAGGASQLLELLERPGASGAELRDGARDWLAGQPNVLVWVIDDAGEAEAASGRPAGAVGVANLTSAPMAAWAESVSAGAAPAITAVSPMSVRRVTRSPAREAGAAGNGPVAIVLERSREGAAADIQVGDVVRRATLFSVRTPVLAPGAMAGPFQGEWKLPEWLSAGVDDGVATNLGPWAGTTLADPAWATACMIYRGVEAPPGQGTSAADRWLLFVEAKRPAGAGVGTEGVTGETGFVRVWFGPTGRSAMVLRVMEDGRVIDESASPAAGRDVPRLVRAAESATGWAVWVPVPASVIEGDGTLRIGLERIDSRGVRTTWPRPCLPWQPEPARIALDTSSWTEQGR